MSERLEKINLHWRQDDGQIRVQEIDVEGWDRARVELDHGRTIGFDPESPDDCRLGDNGQRRLSIRAWRGCVRFEDFQPITDVTGQQLLALARERGWFGS